MKIILDTLLVAITVITIFAIAKVIIEQLIYKIQHIYYKRKQLKADIKFTNELANKIKQFM